jgi:hypothetical protein
MNRALNLAAILLRLRLALRALDPLMCGALVLCLAAGVALAWLVPQAASQGASHQLALRMAAMPPAVVQVAPAGAVANANLALFQRTLGQRRAAEQQVRTLFELADKTGLTLSQGEYKTAYDQVAGLHTYQVTLPVKGSYRAIWQFGLLALRAMPFASLDEISFKREAIGQAQVEAHLRLTLYLADPGPGAAP